MPSGKDQEPEMETKAGLKRNSKFGEIFGLSLLKDKDKLQGW